MSSIFIFDMPVCKKPLDDTTLTERQALTVRCSDQKGVMPKAPKLIRGPLLSINIFDMAERVSNASRNRVAIDGIGNVATCGGVAKFGFGMVGGNSGSRIQAPNKA